MYLKDTQTCSGIIKQYYLILRPLCRFGTVSDYKHDSYGFDSHERKMKRTRHNVSSHSRDA